MEKEEDRKIQIIVLQTDYTEEEARTKLSEFEQDHMKVIRSYLGITEKKSTTNQVCESRDLQAN